MGLLICLYQVYNLGDEHTVRVAAHEKHSTLCSNNFFDIVLYGYATERKNRRTIGQYHTTGTNACNAPVRREIA